jgi:hypothetical protein
MLLVCISAWISGAEVYFLRCPVSSDQLLTLFCCMDVSFADPLFRTGSGPFGQMPARTVERIQIRIRSVEI